MNNNNAEEQDLIDFLSSPSPTPATTTQTLTAPSSPSNTSNDVDDVRNTRKQRIIKNDSSPEHAAARARRNSYKKKSDKNGILDNPQIAPPPILPPYDQRVKARYEINAEYEANYLNMPLYAKIRHSGEVMTRFSAFSLITKKWYDFTIC